MQQRYKLTVAATLLGISPWTLREWVYAGRAPSIKSETGRVFIPGWWVAQQVGEAPPTGTVRCAIYARASSAKNQAALASQKEGLLHYATAKGYQVVQVVSEVGSGVSDARKKLQALLKQRDFDVLLVEHKDRLTRFGFHWLEEVAPFRIEVANLAEDQVNDLMDDLVAILTAFSARLYGPRRGRQKTQAALKALQESD